MRLVLLGSPGTPGDPIERWHDDAYDGALELGWETVFLRARASTSEDILRACRGADMLVWMRTHDYNIRGEDGREMLRKVEDSGVTTVGVHFDLYWGIRQRAMKVGVEPWWTAQHVFTADGGKRPWDARGVNHHWLPPAFGTRYLGYGTRQAGIRHRAVFVGSNIRGIHSPHRSQLLSWANNHWGPSGFQHVGKNRNARVYGRDLNDLYASVDVVLGDSAIAPKYWSDRLPRTLGRGALLAYPDTAGLNEWGFTDDVMIRYVPGRFRQILDKLRALTPEDRRNMTDAAIALVEDRHLWRHRLAHIAKVVGV